MALTSARTLIQTSSLSDLGIIGILWELVGLGVCGKRKARTSEHPQVREDDP